MHKAVWAAARGKLRDILDDDTFERWISVMEPVSFADGKLTLAVGNEMEKIWIDSNFLPMIARTAAGATETPVSGVELVVNESIAIAAAPERAPAPPAAAPPPRAAQAPRSSAEERQQGHSLNQAYTFDEFIEGPSNSFARAGALAVAANPGCEYNPFFIYGDTGLGKTHLMQAIAHSVLMRSPKASICYISSEALLNDYIESIINRTMPDFRKRYRSVDVLLVDDVHFLASKEGIQEEFFHIYNVLHNERKQIVMTSDRPLNKIQGLEARLVSRFQQGLVTSIEKPEFETRVAILRYKQRKSEFKLPDNLLNFIGENITSNVRQLEGAIVKVVSYAALSRQPVTIDSVGSLLKDMIDQEKRPELTFSEILKTVADVYNVRIADLTSRERPQSVALPRQIAMFLCRCFTNGSLPEIGKVFEKNHSTIVHACKTIPGRMETDADLKHRVWHIVERLGRDPAALP
jgi:chromosomal replication initiator protein DnaA